jgi:hypothetical protein
MGENGCRNICCLRFLRIPCVRKRKRWAIYIDAAKVRIEPRAPQEKTDENRETWRDLKAGCWYEGEIVPPSQRSTRQEQKAEREGTVLRARNKTYFCDIDTAEQFGKLLWASACAVGADRARTLVFICDGAV